MDFHTPAQGSWRWYTDATPDGSMTALAAENTAPTLTTAQVQNGIVRLRVQITETGGGAGTGNAIQLQYSQDNTNWRNIANDPVGSGDEGVWIRWADGAATAGNTIGTQLLTSTTASGKYHEVADVTEDVAGSAVHEIDCALQFRWPPPDTTIRLRVVYGGTALSLDTGESQIQVTMPTPANREAAIDSIASVPADGARPTDIEFGFWHRVFYDGTRWWFFCVHPDDASNVSYYYSDTNGDNWSSRQTVSMSGSMEGTLMAPGFKIISGTPVVFIATRISSSTRYYRRGEISGTTITWDSEQSPTYNSGRHVHVDCDDGDYWWMAGVDETSPGIWAARATNADSGSSWTAGFGTRHTATISGMASGDHVRVVGLASDKALVIAYNGSNGNLYWSLVDDTGGFGTVNTLYTSCHESDWGVVRSGGFVYVVLADGTSDDGARKLRVFDESTETFSAGPDPGEGGSGDTGSADGLPLVAVGDDIYMFGVYQTSEGGQAREMAWKKYAGPDDSGTWDSTRTAVTPGGNRGNLDYSTASPGAGGGVIMAVTLHGDDNLIYSDFTIEYYKVAVSTALTVNLTHITNSSTLYSPTVQVEPQVNLTHIATSSALYTPAMELTATPGHIASTSTLYSPSVEPSIALGHIASDSTLYSPSMELTATPGHIASSTTVHSLTAANAGIDLNLTHIANSSTLYAPTIDQTINLTHIANTSTLYSPAPEATAALGLITSDTTLYTPAVEPSVAPGFIASTSTLYTPAMELTAALGLIASDSTLYSPTVSSGLVVALGFIASETALYSLTASEEPQVNLSQIASTTAVYSLTASAGLSVALGHIASETTLYSPAMELTITPGYIANSSTLYSPTIEQTINLTQIASASTVYSLTVGADQGINLTHIASSSSVYGLTLSVGGIVFYDSRLAEYTLFEASIADYELFESAMGDYALYEVQIVRDAMLAETGTLGVKVTFSLGADGSSFSEPDAVEFTVIWEDGTTKTYSWSGVDTAAVSQGSVQGVYRLHVTASQEGHARVQCKGTWNSPAWVEISHEKRVKVDNYVGA